MQIKKSANNRIEKFYGKYYAYKVKKQAKKTGTNLHVNDKSNVTPNTLLGNNVNFNGMSVKGEGNVIIGNNFHSGSGCSIYTSQHNFNNGTAIPYDSTYCHNDVIIEDNVWFGNNVTVMGGGKKAIIIGEGAIIQYGSVVVSSIPPMAIAGGHPAKVFKYRDEEHYKKLKDEGKFH